MCTAIAYKGNNTYFGRTLDIECNHGEKIVLTPRNFVFNLKNGLKIEKHYAIIGTAVVNENYPLYFDAVNEKGLAAAGLNFPDNAVYNEKEENKNNLASFELINYILSVCDSVESAKRELKSVNITNDNFSANLPASPLHFMFADKNEAITVEPVAEGLAVYDNKIGVLTNNPPFAFHTENIKNYMGLSNENPNNNFSKTLDLQCNSRGMGAIGLPGDLSSASRFTRVAFVKENATPENEREREVMQFFNVLGSVNQVRGCNLLSNGLYEYTAYTSCADLKNIIYYIKTYYGCVSAVSINCENLNEKSLKEWSFLEKIQINNLN